MTILGLHINTGQTAAALLMDGKISYAAAEERFNRVKMSRAFPRRAIEFCLERAGLKRLDDLDAIAISWNPADNMRHINLSGFTNWRRYDPEWLYIVPNNLFSISGEKSFQGEYMKLNIGTGKVCPVYFVRHHQAHLAHAVWQSPFKKCLAAIVDEYGEFNSVTIALFDKGRIRVIKEIPYPHSLGVFYATFTEYLGFTPNSDEWKLMGAAAYGNAKRFSKKLETIFAWNAIEGEWILDGRYIEHSNMKRAGYLTEKLETLMGIPRRTNSEDLKQEHYDLAAAAQAVFEKRLFQLLSYYAKRTGEKNMAASGGCFMNSLANGKILTHTPFKSVFIPYAAADNGGAMGAALYVWHSILNHRIKNDSYPSNPFLGPEYSDADIENTLKKYKIRYKKPDNIAKYAAGEIAKGKLVGWFQGGMEFGERALGNRSILADPRDAGMKDRINAAVKYREAFRPFAPSVLAEKADDFFDMPKGVFVPYMEQVYPVKKAKQKLAPAIVHADGTGRLQMVSKDTNQTFHNLISHYYKLTGVPLVLNTSFNVQGEPIVCSPSDAIRTFYSCGLDVLVIGKNIIEKDL